MNQNSHDRFRRLNTEDYKPTGQTARDSRSQFICDLRLNFNSSRCSPGIIDNVREESNLASRMLSNSNSKHRVFIESPLHVPEHPFIFQSRGTFWEQYKELATLGEGCLGVVKKCVHIQTDAIYAVKVVRTRDEEKIQGVKLAEQIIREFEKIHGLNHQNIVRVYELHLDFEQGYVFCVMEYIKGLTLNSYMESSKKLPAELITKYFAELVDAMIYLLSRKVVHRDISPSNVVIAKKDPHDLLSHLKLIDFNVAKFFDEEETSVPGKKRFRYSMLTETGTVKYRAPEIIKREAYSEAADIWSMGCLLYRMVEGKDPFESE